MAYVNILGRQLPGPLQYLGELATFRHLCWSLVGADLRARFRRSHLGIIWAIIQPLAFSIVIAAVWGSVLGADDNWTFALYVFSGIIVWEYFVNVLNGAQDSLLHAEGHLRQTRIPFLIFQVRLPLTSMIILLCASLGLFGMQAVLGQLPELGPHLFLVPVFYLCFLSFGIPLAIVMSILGTKFRDLKHISSIMVSGLFFLSPVMLGRSILEKPELAFLSFVNPMVVFIDLFRAPLLESRFWTATEMITAGAWIAGLWALASYLAIRSGRRLVYSL